MKRIISILLSIITIIIPLTVFANAESEIIPRISIRGFMSTPLYNGDGKQLWPLDADDMLKNINILGPEMVKLSVTGNWDKFGDAVVKSVNNIFGDLRCDKDGNPLNQSGTLFKYPAKEEIEKNPVIEYNIDWRLDPFKIAEDLNDFVLYLDSLGYHKVVFDTHSFANTILITYLTIYGTEHTKSICMLSSAYYGAGFAGCLVKGEARVNADALIEYLKGAVDHNQYKAIIDLLLDLIKKSGLNITLSDFVNKLFEKQGEKIYMDFAIPLFGCWPAIWAMTADEDVYDGMDYVFGTMLKNKISDYAPILEKINRYNNIMRSDRKGIMENINNSCNLYIFSNYGYANLPLFDGWSELSDSVVNTKYTSFGATCKAYNSTEKFTGKWASPNGLIDASTAQFKNQTWFFRNGKHRCVTEETEKMIETLLFYDGQATIDTFENYPQFMMYDSANNTVRPDVKSDSDVGIILKVKKLAEFSTKLIERFLSLLSHKKYVK